MIKIRGAVIDSMGKTVRIERFVPENSLNFDCRYKYFTLGDFWSIWSGLAQTPDPCSDSLESGRSQDLGKSGRGDAFYASPRRSQKNASPPEVSDAPPRGRSQMVPQNASPPKVSEKCLPPEVSYFTLGNFRTIWSELAQTPDPWLGVGDPKMRS